MRQVISKVMVAVMLLTSMMQFYAPISIASPTTKTQVEGDYKVYYEKQTYTVKPGKWEQYTKRVVVPAHYETKTIAKKVVENGKTVIKTTTAKVRVPDRVKVVKSKRYIPPVKGTKWVEVNKVRIKNTVPTKRQPVKKVQSAPTVLKSKAAVQADSAIKPRVIARAVSTPALMSARTRQHTSATGASGDLAGAEKRSDVDGKDYGLGEGRFDVWVKQETKTHTGVINGKYSRSQVVGMMGHSNVTVSVKSSIDTVEEKEPIYKEFVVKEAVYRTDNVRIADGKWTKVWGIVKKAYTTPKKVLVSKERTYKKMVHPATTKTYTVEIEPSRKVSVRYVKVKGHTEMVPYVKRKAYYKTEKIILRPAQTKTRTVTVKAATTKRVSYVIKAGYWSTKTVTVKRGYYKTVSYTKKKGYYKTKYVKRGKRYVRTRVWVSSVRGTKRVWVPAKTKRERYYVPAKRGTKTVRVPAVTRKEKYTIPAKTTTRRVKVPAVMGEKKVYVKPVYGMKTVMKPPKTETRTKKIPAEYLTITVPAKYKTVQEEHKAEYGWIKKWDPTPQFKPKKVLVTPEVKEKRKIGEKVTGYSQKTVYKTHYSYKTMGALKVVKSVKLEEKVPSYVYYKRERGVMNAYVYLLTNGTAVRRSYYKGTKYDGKFLSQDEYKKIINTKSSSENKSVKEAIRCAMDIAGFIPGIGEAFDAIQAGWYLYDKEYISAIFSGISLVPFLGSAVAQPIKHIFNGVTKVGSLGVDAVKVLVNQLAKHSGKVIDFVKAIPGKLSKVFDNKLAKWVLGKKVVKKALEVISSIKSMIDTGLSKAKKALSDIKAKLDDFFKKTEVGCFVAGTLIATESGLKPIEDVEVGEYVYSKNIETSAIELKRVEMTFIKTNSSIYKIQIDGEEIVTTKEHPFWVVNKGWVEAKDLKAEDRVIQKNGIIRTIDQVIYAPSNGTTVYNFSVEDNHNYFVTDRAILVHNNNPCAGNIADKFRNVDNDILDVMEKSASNPKGGHTLAKHVSKTNQDLITRAIKEGVDASAFTNKSTAIKAVQENLRNNADDIASWLANSGVAKKTFNAVHNNPIGKGVLSGKNTIINNLTKSTIVLVKDSAQELGFRIITAFPKVK